MPRRGSGWTLELLIASVRERPLRAIGKARSRPEAARRACEKQTFKLRVPGTQTSDGNRTHVTAAQSGLQPFSCNRGNGCE